MLNIPLLVQASAATKVMVPFKGLSGSVVLLQGIELNVSGSGSGEFEVHRTVNLPTVTHLLSLVYR